MKKVDFWVNIVSGSELKKIVSREKTFVQRFNPFHLLFLPVQELKS